MNTETLKQHIDRLYAGNKARFAEEQGVSRQQVNNMMKLPFIVIDGGLYLFRKELKGVSYVSNK